MIPVYSFSSRSKEPATSAQESRTITNSVHALQSITSFRSPPQMSQTLQILSCLSIKDLQIHHFYIDIEARRPRGVFLPSLGEGKVILVWYCVEHRLSRRASFNTHSGSVYRKKYIDILKKTKTEIIITVMFTAGNTDNINKFRKSCI